MIVDKKVLALVDEQTGLQASAFVYPELVCSGYLFGEELEEAILEYLERRGFRRYELQTSGEWTFESGERWCTTKCLKIRLV